MRLAGGVADHRRAGRQRGGHEHVLGRHHGRLVQEDVGRTQAARGVQRDLAVAPDARAHRAEGVEVRVEAATADDVAARRRHHGAVEAREQRAGEQERGADRVGELRVDLDLGVAAAHSAPRWRRASRPRPRARAGARASPSTSRIRGTLPTTTSSAVSSAGREDRERPVLVPGRPHRAGQRDAAFDYELLHFPFSPAEPLAPDGDVDVARGDAHVGLCKPNSHLPTPVRDFAALPCLPDVCFRARERAAIHQPPMTSPPPQRNQSAPATKQALGPTTHFRQERLQTAQKTWSVQLPLQVAGAYLALACASPA